MEEGREFPFQGGKGRGREEFIKGSVRAHKRSRAFRSAD